MLFVVGLGFPLPCACEGLDLTLNSAYVLSRFRDFFLRCLPVYCFYNFIVKSMSGACKFAGEILELPLESACAVLLIVFTRELCLCADFINDAAAVLVYLLHASIYLFLCVGFIMMFLPIVAAFSCGFAIS